MRRAIIFILLGFLIMAVSIAYAMIWGNFFEELEIMRSLPWFHLSMIDLYVGFLLFAGWILFRERSLVVGLIWVAILLSLGNLIACLYALIALLGCRGDLQAFWMGSRLSQSGHAVTP